MQELPRVGLILLRAGWIRCAGAQDVQDALSSDTQNITGHLSRHFDLLGPWVVDSPEALRACQQALDGAALDMVLLAFQTWAEDALLVSLLQSVGQCPLVLWCYQPWRRLPRPASSADVLRGSGPAGAFSAFGTLRNLGVRFHFTFGAPDDPRLIQDLKVAGRAARVRQALFSARFGLLPSRSEDLQSTFVDEFRLMADFGPQVQFIPVQAFRQAAGAVSEERVAAYLDHVRQQFPVEEVSEQTLAAAARTALGLGDLAGQHHLDVLAVNEGAQELFEGPGIAPGLYPGLLQARNVLYQPEGDLGAATANFILHALTGSPTLFLEFWFWDEAKNQLVGGHPGMQNPAAGDAGQVWIRRGAALWRPRSGETAQLQFIARPGRATLFQLRSTPTGWQAIAATGMCLEGRPWVEACPHAILRLDSPVDHFLNRVAAVGATPHWIMAYGSVVQELEAFCRMARVPLETITY